MYGLKEVIDYVEKVKGWVSETPEFNTLINTLQIVDIKAFQERLEDYIILNSTDNYLRTGMPDLSVAQFDTCLVCVVEDYLEEHSRLVSTPMGISYELPKVKKLHLTLENICLN